MLFFLLLIITLYFEKIWRFRRRFEPVHACDHIVRMTDFISLEENALGVRSPSSELCEIEVWKLMAGMFPVFFSVRVNQAMCNCKFNNKENHLIKHILWRNSGKVIRNTNPMMVSP